MHLTCFGDDLNVMRSTLQDTDTYLKSRTVLSAILCVRIRPGIAAVAPSTNLRVHYKAPRTRGHETAPVRVQEDIEYASRELDNGSYRMHFLDETTRILRLSEC
ncbi:hypothetical protein TNCV_2643081 [Trichonephila clavipes]|nr:hypothetical protein TNCV_2643081 [Trichonephila clavipes]